VTESPVLLFLGYAVTIGQFYDDAQSYFAVGGPRDGGSGKVFNFFILRII
jgi:hypothetical protein